MSDITRQQLLDVIKQQNVAVQQLIGERDRLRAELGAFVAWANGDLDALSILQKTYLDPQSSEASRIKAAAAAIAYERSKPASVVVQVDFKERVRAARLRQLELDRREWAKLDEPKLDLESATPATLLGREPDEPQPSEAEVEGPPAA
jgi:hypothetical protein